MITISISHRSLRIAGILIVILILTTMAIPAGSFESSKKEPIKINPSNNPEITDSPILAEMQSVTVRMDVIKVNALGINEVEGISYMWAMVRLKREGGAGSPTPVRILYIPNVRFQSLFELAITEGGDLLVEAHQVATPEEINLIGDGRLFQVTSARLSWGKF